MKINWSHKTVCGIYCIKNTINNKVYVGKSISIARRIHSHIYELNSEKSHCIKLLRAWKKYGAENFTYKILEEINKDRENFKSYIADREVFWMDELNSIEKGYNLKRDSSTECIVHESTKEKFRRRTGSLNSNFGNYWSEEKKNALSNKKKEMFKNGLHKIQSKEQLIKNSEAKKKKWKENPELIKEMTRKCNLTKIKYEIHQLSKNGNLIKIWKDILELINVHPEYKRHNIYAVCSGEKPSMYGFKWVKVRK